MIDNFSEDEAKDQWILGFRKGSQAYEAGYATGWLEGSRTVDSIQHRLLIGLLAFAMFAAGLFLGWSAKDAEIKNQNAITTTTDR